MAYHSSKGLEFDCVILPFSSFINSRMQQENLLYVALTISSKQIIITYTGLTSEEYSCSIDVSTYDGRIYRGSEKNYNTKINEGIMKILKKIHKGGSDHLFG